MVVAKDVCSGKHMEEVNGNVSEMGYFFFLTSNVLFVALELLALPPKRTAASRHQH